MDGETNDKKVIVDFKDRNSGKVKAERQQTMEEKAPGRVMMLPWSNYIGNREKK